MAASIHNRQSTNLEPGFNHRSDSPSNRSCNFTSSNTPPFDPKSHPHYSNDDDDSDSEEFNNQSLYQTKHDVEPSIYDPRDERTLDSWIKRNPSLIRLTGKHPFNCEPPLARLMQCGFITPTPLHYVRNHGSVPKADWSTWAIEITGLVKRPARITVDQLVHEFAPIEIPVTLVCAGNRRKEQNMVRQTVGFNWGPGAISTSVWRGARLCDVLKSCGIMGRKNGALNVCFEGADELSGGGGCKYGTSVRREVAMDPARDIMLVYMQNGEVLSPDHGFPVRVIVPGFIGGRMVKWLKRIIVTTQESDSYYHYNDNRVLPSHIDAELANSEAWWYKPEYIINELNINSVITTPNHDEILPITSMTSNQPFTLKGYAYSGGGRKITRVEITVDGGDTWQVCTLELPEKPSKYGKYWCWGFWSIEVEILDLLGAKEVAVRAWDESLNTQSEKLIWNVKGMMNNCWFRVKINICRPNKGEIGLKFEHPTQPGNQSGGWMPRQMHMETAESAQSLKKSMSAPFMNTSTKQFTFSEVSKHSTKDSAWIVVSDQVYDCTSFLKDHPGGTDSILINAGTDCTEEFEAIHSDKAKVLLDMYRIGELVANGRHEVCNVSIQDKPQLVTINETITGPVKALINPREKVQCKLVYKKEISHDVRLFRFALPSPDQVLGLAVGKHIFVYGTVEGKQCMRAYTPTSSADQIGHFDLVIKIYFKGENPKFPNGGLLSQHLESLPLGSTVNIKGPLGHIEYTGCGNFMISGKNKFAKRLAMIAGGSGITPVYQVIQAVLRDQPNDNTTMHLVYANRTEDDILLKEELDQWAAMYPDRLKVWYVVSQLKGTKESWSYSTGYVNEVILRNHVPIGGPEDTLAFVCGPPQMIKSAVLPKLAKMSYDVENSCFIF